MSADFLIPGFEQLVSYVDGDVHDGDDEFLVQQEAIQSPTKQIPDFAMTFVWS